MDDQACSDPVEVFYLLIETDRYGFRWIVRQHGRTHPVLSANQSFPSLSEARKAGRSSLIAASARARPTRRTRKAKPAEPSYVSGHPRSLP